MSIYEEILLKEISKIEDTMNNLLIEKNALLRQLRKARLLNVNLKDVDRKNSINRIMVEMRVIEILKENKKPLSTNNLFTILKNIDGNLNPNTFRIYLHRMKNKNIICNANKNGMWLLNSVNK